ncbi:hypothetical protein Pan44_36190 [Caulifigura coniformis]|uniref:Uncharacterized protein n=1 Tax=Caulifigura coniformis TaxID=2527983 RepID=A0A517SHH2_9PLAN|nr:hypothetical protein [Caulifigura coniformis]QDT55574.1 hypothetical protein Pan44_36190 [Caulifigura coniformis]
MQVLSLCWLALWLVVIPLGTTIIHADEPASSGPRKPVTLRVVARPDNDLVRGLVLGGTPHQRFDSAEAAISDAPPASAVLVLADGYPERQTSVTGEAVLQVRQKKLMLYWEYPDAVPGIEFGPARGVQWERGIVAADDPAIGLPGSRIVSLQDCRFLPVAPRPSLLVLGRVAGFNTAVYGIPDNAAPLLFRADDQTLIATTKLSGFVTARLAPTADWVTIWRAMLASLDPAGSPHSLKVTPTVSPSYSAEDRLPNTAERDALRRCANWFRNSGLLISAERRPRIEALLRAGQELTDAESGSAGDGSHGILEGYASQIRPDGSQPQRTPIRADCQAESAAVLALHGALFDDDRSRQVARNLLNFLYVDSELHRGDRGNPRHPSFGLIAWGAVAPAWQVANYGDDNARVLLATIVAAAALESDAWDEAVLKALYANLRTTGRLGFRGDRIDMPQLQERGWRAYRDSATVNVSPSFEAYLWACYLWAYRQTRDQEFLDTARAGICRTMQDYPAGWRWGDHLDRSRMLLPLAWLVRLEDTAEHRGWLKRVSDDLLRHQQPSGAIPEQLSGNAGGHFVVPKSNEAYGTTETPLLQQNGDPVTDQLYTTNFVLIGLHEAVAATNDPALKAAENRLAEYVVRIQVRAPGHPAVDGTWFRAFDYARWDYWSSSGDLGWGAWCAEAGWGPAWNGIVLGLRLRERSLWDMTTSSRIAERLDHVRSLMSQNDGRPFVTAPAPSR